MPGILFALLLAAAAPALAQPFPADMCAADRSGSDLGCTANDIDIAAVTVNNGVTSCVAGTSVSLDLSVAVQLNANRRYDIGAFIALDGKSPIVRSGTGGSASCAVFGLPNSPPPLANLDGNACGDAMDSGDIVVPIGLVTLPCTPDATGQLLVPAVVTWDNNSTSTSCQAPPSQWVRASTKSGCSAGIAARIPVTVAGSITVIKDTIPDGSPGSFSFTAARAGATVAGFELASGESRTFTTANLGSLSQTYRITELTPIGFDLSSIQCFGDLDDQEHPEFVSVDLQARTVDVSMSANGTVGLTAVTCHFANTRHSSITVVKKTVGGDTTFPFTGPSPFAIATVDGSGQRVFAGLQPGSYTISELLPDGWMLTDLSCTDPSGDTALLASTANITLDAAEDVVCTWSNTALGTIRIEKRTVGGDGTFTFSGPEDFQITTVDGVGGPFTLRSLEPGIHSISEAVPADWQLGAIDCNDPTGNSTASGNTATIDLAAGELVTCTYENTRQASVIVETQSIGGDGTFAYTGSQAFSITTTTGNGANDTAFASVAPGVALTIVESVPAGWTLTHATCRDAASGNPMGSSIVDGVEITPAAGQAIVCTFGNTRGATLRVFKHAVPQGTQAFPFTLSGPVNATFTLVDDGSGAGSTSFVNLPAGDYTVTEAPVPGWSSTGITCSDIVEPDLIRRSTIDRSAASITAHLAFGQTLECTFTNTRVQPGSITVHKKAVGGDGTFDFIGSGPGVLTAFSIATSAPDHTGSRVFGALAAGTYTIAEQVPPGWDLAPQPIACTVTGGSNTTITPDGSNGVTIALGATGTATDSVACEFVDIKRGSITIAKQASPEDPQAFAFTAASLVATTALPPSFQLVDDGSSPDSLTFDSLLPSIYTITEDMVPGWRLDDVDCRGGDVITSDPADRVAIIDLQPGEDIECTFSNAKDGSISVSARAEGGVPGDAFTFAGDLSGSIGHGQSISARFPDGSYTISEVVPPGWKLANIECSGGTVTYTGDGGSNPTPAFAPGDTTVNVTISGAQAVACTFSNVKKGSIRVVKHATGGDAAFDFTGARDFQVLTNGGTGDNTDAFESVAPGTYEITEAVPPGWRLTALSCSNASSVDSTTATVRVDVAAGEDVTCTFNDALASSITITKRIRGASSTAFGFVVPATLDPAGTFTLTPTEHATASRMFTDVVPGSYTITEASLPAGWTLTGITCTGASARVELARRSVTIELAIGEAVECIFDNSTLSTVTVSVLSIGGAGKFDFNGRRVDNLVTGALPFAVTTVQDTLKASSRFESIAPGLVSVNGVGAPGFEFAEVTCFGSSPERSWVETGSLVAIAVAEGDVIECIYYYDAVAAGRPDADTVMVMVPVLESRMLWLLALLLLVLAVGAICRRV